MAEWLRATGPKSDPIPLIGDIRKNSEGYVEQKNNILLILLAQKSCDM